MLRFQKYTVTGKEGFLLQITFFYIERLSVGKRLCFILSVSLCFTLSVSLSVGKRQAEINVAEGQKTARILASEANKTEQVNAALGKDYV